MRKVIKRLILKKRKGNTTSLYLGQMVMLLLIVYGMFQFRMELLNTTFNYIDDAIVCSLLGGILPDEEFHGSSNQVVVHEPDTYVDTTELASSKGYTDYEIEIELSTLRNSGFNIEFNGTDASSLPLATKQVLSNNRSDWVNDKTLRRSISAIVSNLVYNISNGFVKTPKNAEEPISSVSGLDEFNLRGTTGGSGAATSLKINKEDVINKAVLANYITSDIEITRLDIYNIYRANLAIAKPYQSQWFQIEGAGTPGTTWDTDPDVKWINYVNRNNASDVIHGIKTEADFDKVYANKGTDEYNRIKAVWKQDTDFLKNHHGNYVYYLDSGRTYQGLTPAKLLEPDSTFKYFYANGTNGNFRECSIPASDLIPIQADKKAPISTYSILSYTSSNSPYGYGTNITYDSTDCNINSDVQEITLSGGKMNGTKITGTSAYVEITFSTKIFPRILGEDFIEDSTVTVSRLVSVESTGLSDRL